MKLNSLSRSATLIEEKNLQTDLDASAGEELDGKDGASDSTISLDDILAGSSDDKAAENHVAPDMAPEIEPEAEMTARKPYEIQKNANSGYTLGNVGSQLDGIVKNWFQFAVTMKPDQKERFLALGERLSEIAELVKTEFT